MTNNQAIQRILVALALFATSKESAYASASLSLTHTSPDTITINAKFTGDECFRFNTPLPGGVVVSARGGTTDGIIHLSLLDAHISATRNGTPVTGTNKSVEVLSTVNDLFLMADPQLTLSKTDIFNITITGAKVKSAGEVGIEVGYANPDPRKSVEFFCQWDSLGQGGQHLMVNYVYPSLKPSPSPTPNPSPKATILPVQDPTSLQSIQASPSSTPYPPTLNFPRSIRTTLLTWWTGFSTYISNFFH